MLQNSCLFYLKEVTRAASSCGLGTLRGAVFNPSIFDLQEAQPSPSVSISARPTDESDVRIGQTWILDCVGILCKIT